MLREREEGGREGERGGGREGGREREKEEVCSTSSNHSTVTLSFAES